MINKILLFFRKNLKLLPRNLSIFLSFLFVRGTKRTLFFLLHSLFIIHHSSFLFAQTKTDSLLHVRATLVLAPSRSPLASDAFSRDTSLANLYNQLSWEYYLSGSYDTSLLFADSAITVFQKHKFNKGIAKAYNNIGLVYKAQSDYSRAYEFLFKSLKIREESGDKRGMAVTYRNIGSVYYSQGDYSRAYEFYFKSLKKNEEIGDKRGMAASYGNIGRVYYSQGDYSRAYELYFKSLKITEEIGDKRGMAASYGNIGIVYYSQGDYPMTYEFLFKSLKINEDIGDKRDMAASYNNIGSVYSSQGDYSKAYEFYFKSLKIEKEIGNKGGMALSYNNIGNVYKSQCNYSRAYEFYFKSLKIAEDIGDKSSLTGIQNNLAELYFKQEQYIDAGDYNRQSLKLALEIGSLENIKNSYYILSKLDSVYQRNDSSYRHFVLAGMYNDSIWSDENMKQIGRAKKGYEMYETERAFKQEEDEENRRERERVSRRNSLQIAGIGGFVLLFVLVAMFLVRRFVKAKWQQNIRLMALLIFFQYVLLLIDPWADSFTQGVVLYKVFLNIGFALVFYPVNWWLERKMNKRTFEHSNIRTFEQKKFPSQTTNVFFFAFLCVLSVSAVGISPITRNQQPVTSNQQLVTRKMTQFANLVAAHRDSCEIYRVRKDFLKAREHHRKYSYWTDSLRGLQQAEKLGAIQQENEIKKQKLEEKIQAEEHARVAKIRKAKTDMIQYSGVVIGIILLAVFAFMFGKFRLSERVISALLFLATLMLFETFSTAGDQVTVSISGNLPLIKFFINVLIGVVLVPLHGWMEGRLRGLGRLRRRGR